MHVTAYCTVCVSLHAHRFSAGGSCASRLVGKAAVKSSLKAITPQQLGEGEVLDEDVAREVERVGQEGGDGDGHEDAVKVTDSRVVFLILHQNSVLCLLLRLLNEEYQLLLY